MQNARHGQHYSSHPDYKQSYSFPLVAFRMMFSGADLRRLDIAIDQKALAIRRDVVAEQVAGGNSRADVARKQLA